MTDNTALPKVGSRLRITDPSGIERKAEILGYDAHGEMVLARWYEYEVPDEWIPTRWL